MRTIHAAAEKGDLAAVKQFLENNPELLDQPSDLGDNPLHNAVRHGRRKVVELLLDAGANINAPGDHQRTPLYVAVHSQRPPMIKLLLKRGADPGIVDSRGFSPLFFAAFTEDEPITKLLVSLGVPVDLHSAAHINGAEKTLAEFRDGTKRIEDVAHPELLVSGAMHMNSTSLASYLLENGADPNGIGWLKLPLLIQAIYQSSESLVKILLDHGAKVDVVDSRNWTAIQCASEAGRHSEDLVRLLRDHGTVS